MQPNIILSTDHISLDEEREWCQVKAANRKSLANPGTVNREVGLLRSMINLAAEWFALELKPIKYEMAKEEPKERILTEQEIRRLIENSEEPLRHIILVALNTGMRKTEILNLEWDQVNLEEGFIRIEAQRSKNRKIREEKKEKGDRQDTINRHTDIILDYS